MNRKRKSVDVLAQLGEPLPLPYRPTPPQTIKLEEVKDDTHETEQIISDTFRPRNVLLRYFQDRDTEESRPRLPIWQNSRQLSNEFRPEETVLDSIEGKISTLRIEMENGNGIDSEKEALDQINQQLEQIIEQRHENSLMQELQRLQHLNQTSTTKSGKSNYPLWLASAIFIILLGMASYTAGSYSYEYCYYFC